MYQMNNWISCLWTLKYFLSVCFLTQHFNISATTSLPVQANQPVFAIDFYFLLNSTTSEILSLLFLPLSPPVSTVIRFFLLFPVKSSSHFHLHPVQETVYLLTKNIEWLAILLFTKQARKLIDALGICLQLPQLSKLPNQAEGWS